MNCAKNYLHLFLKDFSMICFFVFQTRLNLSKSKMFNKKNKENEN